MTAETIDRGKLLGMSGAYWATCTLHAAVKLEIFTIIGERLITADELAQQLAGDLRATAMLLDALCAMQLLTKSGSSYRNSESARKLLVKNSPDYVGHMIMHHHHLVESWMRLDEAVLSGAAVQPLIPRDESERRESFLMGMYTIAMGTAPGLVPTLDLAGRTRLLDLGGGPGTWAIHFCEHNPGLTATVFDLPTTRPFAEKTIAQHGLSERIAFQAGDFHSQKIEGGYDVVWMSQILHGECPADCKKIVAKAARVLPPGGMLIIHEFILDDDRAAPLFPALFSLNMLAVTQAGQSYSEGELKRMMEKAGLVDIQRTSYRGPMESGVLVGHKH
jgi:SAM-dependent methyltransferase